MKTSGIVRRIDDLGRIVIPKEIRKNLRVRDGDSLEILISNEEEIILRKYSMIKKISDFAQDFTDSIYSFLKHNIIITDTSNIIAVSGPLKKKYLNEEISDNLDFLIKRRDSMLENHLKPFKITPSQEEEVSYTYSIIVANGDAVGMVLIMSQDEKLTETEERIVKIASQFLSKHLED